MVANDIASFQVKRGARESIAGKPASTKSHTVKWTRD
jgi:hypothetical protein